MSAAVVVSNAANPIAANPGDRPGVVPAGPGAHPAVAAGVPGVRPAALAGAPGAHPAVLADPEGLFARNYNRQHFCFAHGLSTNPLFDLDSLIELSRRIPDSWEAYWSNGRVAVNNAWEQGTQGRVSLQDTIANIAENDSIVILKHTEQDPVYGPVLQDFLSRVIDFAGEQMRSDVTIGETLILISSPNRVTPYHMDGETNFLVQVRGDKWFYVYNQDDRTLITDEEREKYFAGDISSAVYKKDRQKDATAYDLRAGYGIHVPTGAPHWVQNKNNVSVAISVNYELESVYRLSKIYKLNQQLRRLGITPTPPGTSQWRDGLKYAAARTLASMRSVVAKAPVVSSVPVWTPPTA